MGHEPSNKNKRENSENLKDTLRRQHCQDLCKVTNVAGGDNMGKKKATTVDARGPDRTRPTRSISTPSTFSLRSTILNFIVDEANAVGSFAKGSPIPGKLVVPLQRRAS